MAKTLFLKDSVPFISIDGKEYEVSNPEILAFNFIPPYEWPGGVELIEREVPTGGSGSTSYPIFETVARLLPKEKKEPEPRNLNSPYNCPIDNKPCYMSNCIHSDEYTALCGNKLEKMQKPESDYKQFEEPK